MSEVNNGSAMLSQSEIDKLIQQMQKEQENNQK